MQALLLAHLLSDFAFQADWMIRAKQRGPLGVTPHLVVVTGLTLLAVVPAFARWWPAALVVILCHGIIDVGKIAIDRRFPRFRLLLFYLDQALHLVVIAAATFLVAGSPSADPWHAPASFWQVVLSFVVVTFVLAITLRVTLPRLCFGSRWWGIFERALVFGTGLLGWGVLAPAIPAARIALWRRGSRTFSRGDKLELVAGGLLALVAGLVLRALIV